MKLLYLSNLRDEGFSGLTYSVPKQIEAQSHLDDVIWYNFLPIERDSWRCHRFYRNPNDFIFDLEEFCEGVWTPDLIVFEGFYAFHPKVTLLRVLLSGIPYVIVPRCAFTAGDQGKKILKKRVCNLLFYRRFARRAAAIHYLTGEERSESGSGWNERSFVEPNGIDLPSVPAERKNRRIDVPEIVFVGRIEPYQKGLDVLFDALELLKSSSDVPPLHISLYGNSINGSSEALVDRIGAKGLDRWVDVRPPVFDSEKDEVLRGADAFLLTSRYEGMSMGLLEACAYGLPCIVTPGTNMADVIEAEGAGWVCALSPEAIADALVSASRQVLSYPEKSDAALRVAKRFSWSSIAESTHKVYLGLGRHE